MTGRAVDPAKADPHKVAMSRQDNRARLAGIVQDRVPRPDRGAIGKAGLTVAQDDGPAAVAKVAREMDRDRIILANLCGRGDKDIFQVARHLGVEL